MRKSRVIAVFLLAVLLSGLAAYAAEETRWYVNEAYGVRIRVPKNWTLTSEGQMDGTIAAFARGKGGGHSYFNIVAGKTSEPLTLEDYVNRNLKETLSLPNLRVLSVSDAVLSGLPAKEIVLQWATEEKEEKGKALLLKPVQFLMVKGEYTYAFTAKIRADRFKEEAPQVRAVMKTLKLTK